MARKPSEVVQINLRIREALRRRLEQAATKANRSINAEMIERIEGSFEQDDLRPQVKSLTEALDEMKVMRAQLNVLAGGG